MHTFDYGCSEWEKIGIKIRIKGNQMKNQVFREPWFAFSSWNWYYMHCWFFSRNVFWSIGKTNGKTIICIYLLIKFHSFFFRIVQPIFMGLLLQSLSEADSSEFDFYFYGGGIVLVSVLTIFSYNSYLFEYEHIAMRAKIGTCSLLYRKVR